MPTCEIKPDDIDPQFAKNRYLYRNRIKNLVSVHEMVTDIPSRNVSSDWSGQGFTLIGWVTVKVSGYRRGKCKRWRDSALNCRDYQAIIWYHRISDTEDMPIGRGIVPRSRVLSFFSCTDTRDHDSPTHEAGGTATATTKDSARIFLSAYDPV